MKSRCFVDTKYTRQNKFPMLAYNTPPLFLVLLISMWTCSFMVRSCSYIGAELLIFALDLLMFALNLLIFAADLLIFAVDLLFFRHTPCQTVTRPPGRLPSERTSRQVRLGDKGLTKAALERDANS